MVKGGDTSWKSVRTLLQKNNDTEAEHEETHGVALVGLPAEGKRLTRSAWSGLLLLLSFLKTLKGREGGRVDPHDAFSHSVCFSAELSRAQRARRVGEFRESEDWSPLLLLRRWALEQDSEEGEGLSGSSMLG